MKYTAKAAITEYYDIDFDISDDEIDEFCNFEKITKEEFLANTDEYRYEFGYFLNNEYGFYDIARHQDSDSEIYEPKFVLDTESENEENPES